MCLGCEESGIPEELVEALEGNQSTRQPGIEMSQFETPDKPGLERTKDSKGEESSKDEDKVFSLTRKQVRKLLDLAKEDYPAQVYRVMIWLTVIKSGLTTKQLCALTKIPLSSVYRTLKGNSIFYSIGKPRRFYADLGDSHQQENGKTIK